MGKTQHTVAMEQNLENYDFGLKDANVKILKNTDDVMNVTMHLPMQDIWGHIWKRTVEKSQTNATNVALPFLKELHWNHI